MSFELRFEAEKGRQEKEAVNICSYLLLPIVGINPNLSGKCQAIKMRVLDGQVYCESPYKARCRITWVTHVASCTSCRLWKCHELIIPGFSTNLLLAIAARATPYYSACFALETPGSKSGTICSVLLQSRH